MAQRKFEPGRCYFLVGYLDRHFKMPFVQSYVFLGRETGDVNHARDGRFKFQDVHSYAKLGPQNHSDDERGIEIMLLDDDGLDTMLDPQALAEEFVRLGV